MITRPSVFLAFSFLTACASAPRPTTAADSCGVVTASNQLDGCVGKTVTVRGKVSGTEHPQIAGVGVQAPASLVDEPAHAVGTLEQEEGGRYVLRNGNGLAKAHGTRVR
jgi:starvation-inducible outer membrane lipoprotein